MAILGRTGCGKSTLLQLLTRAWDPQRGHIRFNNTLLTDFSEQAPAQDGERRSAARASV